MSPQPVSPHELGAHLIGQGIRITWDAAAGGRTAIVQGALESIRHSGHGTSLTIDIGVSYLELSPNDLANGSVELV